MKRLTTCCCFSARTGCIILAALGVFWSVNSVYSDLRGMAQPEVERDHLDKLVVDFKELEEERLIGHETHAFFVGYINFLKDNLNTIYSVDLVISSVAVLTNGLLLWGVLGSRHQLMLPYLAVNMLEIVVVALIFLSFVAGAATSVHVMMGVVLMALFVPGVLISLYFWHVVVSHYAEMRDRALDSVFEKRQLDTFDDIDISGRDDDNGAKTKLGLAKIGLGGKPAYHNFA